MNYRNLMIAIAGVLLALVAVLLVWVVTSLDAQVNEPSINISNSEAATENEEEVNIPGVEDAPEEWIDEDYESEETSSQVSESSAASSSATENKNNSSNSSSSGNSSNSNSSAATSSNNVNMGNGSSNGSGSSGSSSSKPSIEDVEEDGKVTYEEYIAMSGADQKKYLESFESVEKFFKWFNAAKEQYDKENPSIEIGNGSIDMNEIINGKQP